MIFGFFQISLVLSNVFKSGKENMLVEKINVIKRTFFIQSKIVKSSGTFLNLNESSVLELDPLPQEKTKKLKNTKRKNLTIPSTKIYN